MGVGGGGGARGGRRGCAVRGDTHEMFVSKKTKSMEDRVNKMCSFNTNQHTSCIHSLIIACTHDNNDGHDYTGELATTKKCNLTITTTTRLQRRSDDDDDKKKKKSLTVTTRK